MTSKGERTRQMIVEQSAVLFNLYGYSGTSMSDIIARTGIKKGGIYRYFEGKEQIAAEAFAYAIDLRVRAVSAIVAHDGDPVARLLELTQTLLDLNDAAPIPGGCPIMNAAIESDDGPAELSGVREQASRGMHALLGGVHQLLNEAVQRGKLSASVQPDAFAPVVVSLCEGAIMLSRLHDDITHRERALAHIEAYLTQPRT